MSFTSAAFIEFLAAVTAVYYVVPKKFRWTVLLVASYGFYMAGGAATVVYLLFTTLTTYAAGLLLGRLNRRRDALSDGERRAGSSRIKRRKQLVVAAAVVANFGMLYMLKYWDFTVSAAAGISGGAIRLPALDLLMPLGVSFYIFQSVGYVIDCYRAKHEPERNLLKYSLFTSFFPQMVQGPISRFGSLGAQLTAERPFDADNLKYGIQLVMWGYFKKLVIADRAAVIVGTVFDGYAEYSGVIIAFGVLFYCIQLYCDFSGGIDIARGAAKMFGIELEENFRRPLFATGLADFWRRWHITLGQWMKDYVFYSLSLSKAFVKLGRASRSRIGGKLGKILPTALATFIVYFIIGIWHGANFRYIFFGLYNGTIITGSILLANVFYNVRQKLHIREESAGLKVFRIVRTWLLVFVGRYISRAPRLLAAFSMLWTTVSRPNFVNLVDGTVLSLGLPAFDLVVVAVCMAVVVVVEFFQERGVQIRKWLERRHFMLQWLAIAAMLTALLLLGIMRGSYISAEFIYKQF